MSTAGIAPAASAFAERRSNLSELRGQLALSHNLASVAGLAPARVGLKTRLLELLCIHGQKSNPGRRNPQGSCSQTSLNPAVSDPPWRCPSWACYHALPLVGARLVSEQRTEGGDNRDEPGIHQILNHCFNVFLGGRRLFVEQVALSADHPAAK